MRRVRRQFPRPVSRLPLVVATVVAMLSVAAPAVDAAERSGDYAIERVSPVYTGGQRPGFADIRKDGELVRLNSAGAFAGTENSMLSGGSYLSARGAGGWLTRAIAPPGQMYSEVKDDFPVDTAADIETQLYLVERDAERNTKRYVTLRRDPGGTLTEIGPVFDDGTAAYDTVISGSSGDLRTFVVTTSSRVGYTDGRTDTRSAAQQTLMRVTQDPLSTDGYRADQVAYRAGATMLPNCTPVLGGARTQQGAVSEDGRQLLFTFPTGLTSCRAAANQRVWAKIDNADPIDLSATQCTTTCGTAAVTNFEGASLDGRRVYFTTPQKLVDADQDTSFRDDLYVYDADATGSKLRAITASSDLVGAGVRGVTAVSNDGTTVFFVANGRPLTHDPNNRGQVPLANVDNLYVYHQARGSSVSTIRFVGVPSPDDLPSSIQPTDVSWFRSAASSSGRTFDVSTDGAFALIPSHADLAGDRAPGDSYADLFRYDVRRDELRRIWPGDPEHNGTERSHGFYPLTVSRQLLALRRATAGSSGLMMPPDGSVVAVQTAEALDPSDVNGIDDVYLWRAATDDFQLLSGGTATRKSGVSGVSENGDVFFSSDAALLPGKFATLPAAYVARRGGGFPLPPEPPTPCAGDDCQGELPSTAESPPPSGTSRYAGPGNLTVADPTVALNGSRSARASGIVIRVRSSLSGRVVVSGARVVQSTRRVQAGRTQAVRVRLTYAARRARDRGRDVRTSLRVRVTADDGGTATKTIGLRFRARKGR